MYKTTRQNLCSCGCGKPTKIILHTSNKKGLIKGDYYKFLAGHHGKGIPKSIIQKKKMAETRRQWYVNNPEKALLKAKNVSITKIKNGTANLEKNPRWKGGVSFEDYDFAFTDRFKEGIKLRDGGCVVCKLTSINAKRLSKKLHVHHIDYNKKHSSTENCITLCDSCHIRAHTEKQSWEAFFKNYLNRHHNYIYKMKGGID